MAVFKKKDKAVKEKEVKKEAAKEAKKVKAPVTEAKAIGRDLRLTPRKARLLIDLVRGKNISNAVAILNNTNKLGARDIIKVINSAAANATNNFSMNYDKLYIKEIYAGDGIKMKRYMPRAKGSASGLVKRACIVTVVVKER